MFIYVHGIKILANSDEVRVSKAAEERSFDAARVVSSFVVKALSVAVYNHYKRIYHASLHKRSVADPERSKTDDDDDNADLKKKQCTSYGPNGLREDFTYKDPSSFCQSSLCYCWRNNIDPDSKCA